MKSSITHNKAKLILLGEGFVSVSLQVFIMRQLVPFSGSNVTVTSLIIGIFLAFLALGYHVGGTVKDNQLSVLKRNLFVSAMAISIGFSFMFMEVFLSLLKAYIGNTIVEVTIYLMIFLAPPIYLLGQTMPLLTNFIMKQRVAEATGLALSVNTIGSVLGSIMTSLLFISYMGMSWTLTLNVTILCMLAVYISDSKKNHTLIGILIVGLCFLVNYPVEKSRFITTNTFANYSVTDDDAGRTLLINNSLASGITREGKVFEYAVAMRTMMKGLGIEDSNVLVLGAGGFTVSLGDTSNRYQYVDIDPSLKRITENHFLKRSINGDVEFTDARVYLDEHQESYGAIIVDLFTHRTSMPWHVTTMEFMDKLSSRLDDDGFVFFNIISKKAFDDPFSQAIDNTINQNFNFCYKQPIFVEGADFVNLVYGCKKNSIDDSRKVYIDDYADVEIDLSKSAA